MAAVLLLDAFSRFAARSVQGRESQADCRGFALVAFHDLQVGRAFREGTGSGDPNPLDRVEALLESTQDKRIVQWISEKAGGFFILNPNTAHPHPEYLIPATNRIVQEFADLLSVVACAAADNFITDAESKRIRNNWEQLKSVTECFVHCCEEGNFRSLREDVKHL